ncbi:MAG TPA: adenosylhomocysteinase [Acidimicrobiales bacterium]|nr:adenosylhomocysteinase [Acidimicrobiales bacterium]
MRRPVAPGADDGDAVDLVLADLGHQRIAWADAHMRVLATIRERFAAERPLVGIRVGACLHITAETANLLRTLTAGGAQVAACASNPLSTQDEVVASLARDEGITTHAVRGQDAAAYYRQIDAVLDSRPQLTLDDGCDLVSRLHRERPGQVAEVLAGTEDTTTGVLRLRAMEAEGALRYPIVAVNDAETKRVVDNRHGTGQSTLDGILRATNVLLAGQVVVVAGYGSCGRGVASRARGLGARVVVTEVDPLRALEAILDGFQVAPMGAVAAEGDVFVTVTGNRDVLGAEHFSVMKDGAILANAGHFDLEIDVRALEELAGPLGRRQVRPMVEELAVPGPGGRRRLLLLAEGRVVNLGAAEGHPAAVMDMSFANQALVAEWLVRHRTGLEPRVYDVPGAIDREIAAVKLATMDVTIDRLTPAQQAYRSSWTTGT